MKSEGLGRRSRKLPSHTIQYINANFLHDRGLSVGRASVADSSTAVQVACDSCPTGGPSAAIAHSLEDAMQTSLGKPVEPTPSTPRTAVHGRHGDLRPIPKAPASVAAPVIRPSTSVATPLGRPRGFTRSLWVAPVCQPRAPTPTAPIHRSLTTPQAPASGDESVHAGTGGEGAGMVLAISLGSPLAPSTPPQPAPSCDASPFIAAGCTSKALLAFAAEPFLTIGESPKGPGLLESQEPVPQHVPGLAFGQVLFLSRKAQDTMARCTWRCKDYTICRELYRGYASTVSKASCHRSGQDVVLKVYSLSSLSDFLRNQVLRELDIHSRLDHPGVVQLLAAFKEDDKLVLVLEYVRGGSLDRARRKLGGRLSEQQALELVMVPLLRTLHYLHAQSIVHRDIKPANLLFTPDWRLKVCDYGVSICLTEERAVTRTGSRDYMAPEVHTCPLKRMPEDNKDKPELAYGAAVDVWSVGALLYDMMVGFTPFPGGPPSKRHAGDTKTLPFPLRISADARAFVQACLEHDPEERPTIAALLQFPWIQNSLSRIHARQAVSSRPPGTPNTVPAARGSLRV